MRSLALALSWMAFGAIGTEASPQFQIPPEQIEQICRENERSYAGPPMPRVSEPIFSGSGCPSQGQVGYNYRGLWSCHRKSDVQFLIPGLNIKAEKGKLVKAECAITFRVDDLGPGWQVALDEGIFDADVEMAPRSEIRAVGAVDWEGGPKTRGNQFLDTNAFSRDILKYSRWGMRISYRGLYNEFSPCSSANKVVGNLTIKYTLELDATRSTGHALVSTGSWTDEQTREDIDNAATLNLKWLIKRCDA